MHLPDGIIPLDQAIIYWIITIIILAYFFYYFSKNENNEKSIVRIAIFAGCTFLLSAISIPSPLGIPIHFFVIPITSIVLGPILAIPVAFVSLLGQSLLFGMGGITSLGANFLVMGFILAICTDIFYRLFSEISNTIAIFLATLIGIICATFSQVAILMISGAMNFDTLLATLIPFYLFIGVIEGILNVLIVEAIRSLKPELLKIR
ncbi:MAG: cobalamin biosynthesis protein CobM [Methanosphaera sp. SHI1033]|nr:MAG: cobalamin biosynthesis protein CobM [Methanosphaera sp. SHI1033]